MKTSMDEHIAIAREFISNALQDTITAHSFVDRDEPNRGHARNVCETARVDLLRAISWIESACNVCALEEATADGGQG